MQSRLELNGVVCVRDGLCGRRLAMQLISLRVQLTIIDHRGQSVSTAVAATVSSSRASGLMMIYYTNERRNSAAHTHPQQPYARIHSTHSAAQRQPSGGGSGSSSGCAVQQQG